MNYDRSFPPGLKPHFFLRFNADLKAGSSTGLWEILIVSSLRAFSFKFLTFLPLAFPIAFD